MATTFSDLFGQPGLNFGDTFYAEEPRAAFEKFSRGKGLGYGQSPGAKRDWWAEQYPQLYQGFLSRVPEKGPQWTFLQDLEEQMPGLEAQWQGLGARQRGIDWSSLVRPMRWIGI
jgi:hypothetical protein